jgi:Uma2 family endonuclease
VAVARRLANGDGPMTLEAYERLPTADGYRDEVVRGRLVREPLPAGEHGWLEIKLGHFLYEFVEPRGLGRVFGSSGYILQRNPLTLLGPDLSFVARDRLDAGYPSRHFREMAPDLAIEIASPSNRAAQLEEKARQFLAAGTRLVWIVDPARRAVTVHTGGSTTALGIGDALEGGEVLPGFRLPLESLFAP